MRVRLMGIGIGLAVTVGTIAVRAEDANRPDGKTYVKKSFSPRSIGVAGAGAAITQATNTPKEWGQGAVGFAKRFGSGLGKGLVKRGIQYPVSKAFHEELGYQRSDKTGFGPRLKYALTATVITHKTTDGKKTLAKGEIAGAFGSGLISRLWQPASTRTVGLGFTSGGIALGVDAAGNVVREFWPEIRHPHTHGLSENKTPAASGSATLFSDNPPHSTR